jgi:hypothetical protein
MSEDFETITMRPTNRRPFQIRGEMIACAETEEDMSRFQRCAIFRMHDGRLVAEYSRLTSWDNERQYRAFAICADAAEVERFYRDHGPFGFEFRDVGLAQDAMREAGLDLSPKLVREIEAYDAALTAELADYDERYERC